jgi:quercetin dioxygenase-like cupin family protein
LGQRDGSGCVWRRTRGSGRKPLRRSETDQSLVLLRFEAGSRLPPHGSDRTIRLLVLEGALEAGYVTPGGQRVEGVHTRGAFIQRPPGVQRWSASPGGCVCLMALEPVGQKDTAAELPPDALLDLADVFGPGGWHPTPKGDLKSTIPGVWNKPLYIESAVRTWPEMYMHRQGHSLYAVYFEPGAMYPMHPHPYAQQLFFLEGDMEDQIVEGNGKQYTASYRRGAFVDYPYPMEHASFSRGGCWSILGT